MGVGFEEDHIRGWVPDTAVSAIVVVEVVLALVAELALVGVVSEVEECPTEGLLETFHSRLPSSMDSVQTRTHSACWPVGGVVRNLMGE
mmetsp:Transcript_22734/g.44309  ORF Transcript_22734/g.44309 Transcript_22734/m.44309 type:complete len:89 (+) Transcript_22734:1344-1610(+)